MYMLLGANNHNLHFKFTMATVTVVIPYQYHVPSLSEISNVKLCNFQSDYFRMLFVHTLAPKYCF
jgi:hypothetical protein